MVRTCGGLVQVVGGTFCGRIVQSTVVWTLHDGRLDLSLDKDPYFTIPGGGTGPSGESSLWPSLFRGADEDSLLVSQREWDASLAGQPGFSHADLKAKRDAAWQALHRGSDDSTAVSGTDGPADATGEADSGSSGASGDGDGDVKGSSDGKSDSDEGDLSPADLAKLREIEREYRKRVGIPAATPSDILTALFTVDMLCNVLYTVIGSVATLCMLNAFIFVVLTGTDPLGSTTDLASRPTQLVVTHLLDVDEVRQYETLHDEAADWPVVYALVAVGASFVGLSWKLKDLLTNYRCWEFLALQLPCALASWTAVQIQGVPLRWRSAIVALIYIIGMGQYVVRGSLRAIRKVRKWRRKREKRERAKKQE